jgi:photosystem II stability/assembly factor-like uncharacterized protein
MKTLVMMLSVLSLIGLLSGLTAAQTWEAQTSGTNEALNGVALVDQNNGWAVGHSGTILHTMNGGTSWGGQSSGTGVTIFGVAFSDENFGWIATATQIKRTNNGGAIWEYQYSEMFASFVGVACTDSNNVWVTGGGIWHTTNGGTNWTRQNDGTTVMLNSAAFPNASSGWVIGDAGTIVHTTNGGATWSAQTSGTQVDLYGVSFANVNDGWTVGAAGTILHTTNGGANWPTQNSGTINDLHGVTFLDANFGWAVGANGTILRTTNGGAVWAAQTSGTTAALLATAFSDTSHGWATGEGGTILRYAPPSPAIEVYPMQMRFGHVFVGEDSAQLLTVKNTGAALLTVSEMRSSSAFPVLFSLPLLIAAGDSVVDTIRFAPEIAQLYNDTLLIISNAPQETIAVRLIGTGDASGMIPGSDGVIAADYSLLQNYPNPFNPATEICYKLPRAGRVSLRVYDLLGREVAVLKDDFQEVGVYRAAFDGSNLPSGIYVCRLQAGDFSGSRKLVLLK